MTFEFYGWIIENYVVSISPGHGDSGRGRPESPAVSMLAAKLDSLAEVADLNFNLLTTLRL